MGRLLQIKAAMRKLLILFLVITCSRLWSGTSEVRIATGMYTGSDVPEQYNKGTIGYDAISFYNSVPWSAEYSWKSGVFNYGGSLAVNVSSYQYTQIHNFIAGLVALAPPRYGVFGLRFGVGVGVGFAHLFLTDKIRSIPGIDLAAIENRFFLFLEPKAELSIGEPGKASIFLSISERYRYGSLLPVRDGILLGFGYKFELGDRL